MTFRKRSPVSSLALALVSITGTVVLTAACGYLRRDVSVEVPAPPPAQSVRPVWVERRLGRDGKERDEIFAVGASPAHVGDEALAREAADNDARTQLRRVLDGCISTRTPGTQRTAGTLAGSEVKERWQDPESGTWFSLLAIGIGDASDVKSARTIEGDPEPQQAREAAAPAVVQPESPALHRKTRGRPRKRSGQGF